MRSLVRQRVRLNMYFYNRTNIKRSYFYIYTHVSMHVSEHCVAGRTCLKLRSLFTKCKSVFASTYGSDVHEHEHTHTHMLGKRWVLVFMWI